MNWQPGIPQPGEQWRIRIRPVEYECPRCHALLHVGGTANNGMTVRIVPSVQDSYVHLKRGCNATVPLPEGWVWYSTRETDGDQQFYTLPYTLFTPIEEETR